MDKERIEGVEGQSQQPPTATTTKLTLEQELAALQKQTPRDAPGPFRLFDTGCAGTVFFMYAKEANDEDTSNPPDQGDSEDTRNKRPRHSTTTSDEEQSSTAKTDSSDVRSISFDPVKTVKRVASDIVDDKATTDAPASRFLTRMIPVQVTCFATLHDLEAVLPSLLARHGTKSSTTTDDSKMPAATFRVQVKKRQCNQIKGSAFIETAASLVVQETGWKVQLTDPDYIIWIEVCKTLMGVSVLTRDDVNVAKNFNLAELRDRHQHTGHDGDNDEKGTA